MGFHWRMILSSAVSLVSSCILLEFRSGEYALIVNINATKENSLEERISLLQNR